VVKILITPVNRVDVDILDYVRVEVMERLPFKAQIFSSISSVILPLSLYDFDRMQYRADLVNKFLYNKYNNLLVRDTYLIAIVSGDGYVPGMNFVFGLASPELRVASIYTSRIRRPLSMYPIRLVKLVLHELGHLLGLSHCENRCVMRFSNTLDELDEKPAIFCEDCRRKLLQLRGDI